MKIYLATPYSHKSRRVRVGRFKKVNKKAAEIMRGGHVVFSPISHSHPIAETGKINSLDLDFWLEQDMAFMEWCDELWVYCQKGWDESKGVLAEIDIATEMRKGISYIV